MMMLTCDDVRLKGHIATVRVIEQQREGHVNQVGYTHTCGVMSDAHTVV